MSAAEPLTLDAVPERATLEVLWQQDVGATVLARGGDGSLSAGDLTVGIPAVSDLAELGHGASARRVGLEELIALAASPPADLELGGSARATFALIELAARSVTEGLLHPQLQHGGRTWLAYWGATIDESVQGTLDSIAAALPSVCADAFDGDPDALVHDLYACAVDQIARNRLAAAGVRLGHRLMRARPSAPEVLPRRPHVAQTPSFHCTQGSARSSGGSPTGSTRGSSAARPHPGCSAFTSTRGKATRATARLRSSSSSGSRRRTTRRSRSPYRSSTTAAMRSSGSFAPPTRASRCNASSG